MKVSAATLEAMLNGINAFMHEQIEDCSALIGVAPGERIVALVAAGTLDGLTYCTFRRTYTETELARSGYIAFR